MIYNPKIFLDKSPVHGWGVFAKEDIELDEVFEECPILTIPIKFGETSDMLIDYRFNWPQGVYQWEEQVVALGFGSFYNHNENANAYWVSNYDERTFKFISNKKINKGEEIFIWYGDVNYWNDGRNHTNLV